MGEVKRKQMVLCGKLAHCCFKFIKHYLYFL